MKFIFRWVREKRDTIIKLKDTPASIARGVGIGAFFGFIPVVGFKTLLTMGLTRLVRGNVIASVIAVTLHDLTWPVAWWILKFEYTIGMYALGRGNKIQKSLSLDTPEPRHFKLSDFWTEGVHDTTIKLLTDLRGAGWPTLLGSVILSIPVGVIAYYFTLKTMTRIRVRQAAEAAKEI
jgi:uncharacterized protein (DUF2062 family)